MRCFTKRRHIKPHQGRWNSCLEEAAGDHMFIFYHGDKATENSVKHFQKQLNATDTVQLLSLCVSLLWFESIKDVY